MGVAVSPPYPAYSGTFIPEIWSSQMNAKFYAADVLMFISNNTWEGEISDMGDVVHIRQTPDTTVSDHQKGESFSYENLTAAVVDLDINKAKRAAFMVDDIDAKQSDIDLLGDWAEDAVHQFRVAVDTDVLANVPGDAHASNSGATAGAISGDINLGVTSTPVALTQATIVDYIVDVNTVLDEQNVPDENDQRYIVLPAWACGRLKGSDVRNANEMGDARSPLRSGMVGVVDRTRVFNSNLLSVSSSEWDILAGHPLGLAYASQFTKTEYISQLQTTFGSAVRCLLVYGYKVVKPEAIVKGVVDKA